MTETVHVALYDTLADWEPGYALAAINRPLWQKEPGRFRVRTVGVDTTPVRTLGGVQLQPDSALAQLRPADSAMLILPGNDLYPEPRWRAWSDKAREFLDAGVPVAAICGATGGLAMAGLLDDRYHTSNAKAFLETLDGYAGGDRYLDEPAVIDRDLITGAAQSPVDFARVILGRLGVYEPEVLASWYKLYGRQDPAGFYELMSA